MAVRSARAPRHDPPPYAGELAEALRAEVGDEVRFSDGDRALYSYDASIYRQGPGRRGDTARS